MTEEQRQALADTKVWLFDLDNTLYPAESSLFDEIRGNMTSFIEENLNVGREEAVAIRRKYFLEHGTTLAGMMANHGTDPDTYMKYVHDIDFSPVLPNPVLNAVLHRLKGRKIIFTNADSGHANNVMARLGIGHHFEAIFDIADADYLPKPHPLPYERIVADHKVPASGVVMLDDMARNLAPAAEMGMTTVWVRTHYDWSSDGQDEHPHVDHATDDLVAWLEGIAPAG